MKPNRLIAAIGAVCLALILGLMWTGGAPPVPLLVVTLGASLMVGACVLADLVLLGNSTR